MSPAKGIVIVNTGNGKGKTTAALGLLFRAWGDGLKVVMLQFVKGSDSDYGEHKAARRIGVEIIPGGAGFVFNPDDPGPHRELALEQWQEAKKRINSGDYDMVILDELTYPLHFQWITVQEVIDVLKTRPTNLHVVITGRGAPQELIDFADTVVEIKDIKHHFQKGIKAQKGIEL
jgi:cob(I)alamin adenosyltransferase